MCVNVLLADDAEVVRKAIRKLLSERKELKVAGEAATFPEVLQKATELKPDEIVIDLHIPGDGFSTQFPNGHKLLAMSVANDDGAKELAQRIGAMKLLDKMKLADELIPALLEQATSHRN